MKNRKSVYTLQPNPILMLFLAVSKIVLASGNHNFNEPQALVSPQMK